MRLFSFVGFVILFAIHASDLIAEDPVAVLITGPVSAVLGEKLTFEVEIVNRSGKTLEKLRIIDHFDEGLTHAASKSPIEQKGTIDMVAGTARRLTLEFTTTVQGRQCHRVELLDPLHVIVGMATACVDVAPDPKALSTQLGSETPALLPSTPTAAKPSLPSAASTSSSASSPRELPVQSSVPSIEMDLSGPASARPGDVAEYAATIRNTGSIPTGEADLDFQWDAAFEPLEASDGYVMGTSKVSWKVPSIAVGGFARRQINVRVRKDLLAEASSLHQSNTGMGKACLKAVLSGTPGGLIVADESCLVIESTSSLPQQIRASGIRMVLADCDDPVRIGNTTTLICNVTNTSAATLANFTVVISLPETAQLVGDPNPARVKIDGRNISFESVPSLLPGGSTAFELAYRSSSKGAFKAKAVLTASAFQGAMESECTTEFLAP